MVEGSGIVTTRLVRMHHEPPRGAILVKVSYWELQMVALVSSEDSEQWEKQLRAF